MTRSMTICFSPLGLPHLPALLRLLVGCRVVLPILLLSCFINCPQLLPYVSDEALARCHGDVPHDRVARVDRFQTPARPCRQLPLAVHPAGSNREARKVCGSTAAKLA
uniref:Uncharacterized protein n=1 Tax=Alexandrium andersonii TaxID=327968 RepID=A0A7S2C1H6_9DINO